MKIKKISKINNAFSYSFFDWDKINPFVGNRPDSFCKNNIFFAENGNGKSKLVEILKSINENTNSIKKNRDREGDNQEIQIVLYDDSKIDYLTHWTRDILKDKFIFFDKFFINNFVHSVGSEQIDTPQRKQQRGKDIVYLGNFAEYNLEIDRINEIKKIISDKNDNFHEKELAKINGLLVKGNFTKDFLISKRNYINTLQDSEIKIKETLLKELEAENEKLAQGLKNIDKISTVNLLDESKIYFSLKRNILKEDNNQNVEISPNELFSFTVSKGVQKTLEKITNKKEFIKQGLVTMNDDTTECPFCEQKIKDIDYLQIIKDYKNIFDENFTKEENGIKETLLKYREILESLRDFQLPIQNKDYLNEINKFISINSTLISVNFSEDQKNIIKSEISLVIKKEKNILDEINNSNIENIKIIFNEVNNLITQYNIFVKDINLKVKQFKDDASGGKLEVKKINIENTIKQLKEDIFIFENKTIFVDYFNAFDQEKENKKIIDILEKIYQSMKTKIVKEFNSFIDNYFSLIQSFIKEICPSMVILNVFGKGSYNRSNNNPALCGFHIEYNGKDCSSSLSEGEKQVIALAFFFARLKKESIKDKIIIMDDPITSFDAGKRKSTAELIKRETESFEQLFIFTCDTLFREYCLKQQFVPSRNSYYIFKTRGSSSIHYVPNKIETICDAFKHSFEEIEDIDGSNENVVIFGQKLRFCLETKIKEDYLGYSEDNLSNLIEKITTNGIGKIEKLIENKEIILQIYNYCNTGGLAHYPRDGATSWNELKGKINQYLSLDL